MLTQEKLYVVSQQRKKWGSMQRQKQSKHGQNATETPATTMSAETQDSYKPAKSRKFFSKKRVFTILAVGLLVLFWFSPSPYIVERPGQPLDLYAEYDIDGEKHTIVAVPENVQNKTPNTGSLNLLTVNISGNADNPRTWGSLMTAWLSPAEDIVPVSTHYPEGVSVTEVQEASAREMTAAQQAAAAVALKQAGYQVSSLTRVAGIAEGSPAEDIFAPEDQLLAVDQTPIKDSTHLVELIQKSKGQQIQVTVKRQNQEIQLDITPKLVENQYVLGLYIADEFQMPFTVDYAVEGIGGPSAGLVFALTIYDQLVAADITDGSKLSGTGTISGSGKVGAIGGVKQKMYAAASADTELFLLPVENCQDMPSKVPGAMTVAAVDTFSDALAAIQAYNSGDFADIPSCSTK